MESTATTKVSMSNIDEEMVLAHFIVSDDVERSRRFYTEVLGGKTVISGEQGDEVTYVALANSWIIINVGGAPTDDKPTVTLEGCIFLRGRLFGAFRSCGEVEAVDG